MAGAAQTRGCAPQTCLPFIRQALRCSAPLTGKGKPAVLERWFGAFAFFSAQSWCSVSRLLSDTGTLFPSPWKTLSNAGEPGAFGWLCLSRAAASLASRPARRVAQGTPRSGASTTGSPFLWLLSFGEAKESTPAPQRGNQPTTQKPARNPETSSNTINPT